MLALLWIAGSFIGLRALLRLSKQPGDVISVKRARVSQILVSAVGGLTVLIGAGFYYYINIYRTAYATSSSGLPLVDTGAVLGLIAFAWQMAQGSRIRNYLKAAITKSVTGSEGTVTQPTTALPKRWMLIAPPILLLFAFVLMIGGSMM